MKILLLGKTGQVGKSIIKANNNASVFQMERWFDLLKQRGNQARELGLNENFINELFQIIHKYSVEHQNEIYQHFRDKE